MSNTPVQEINIPYPEPEYDKETCKEYHARVVALGFPFEKLTQKHQALYCKGGCDRGGNKNDIAQK